MAVPTPEDGNFVIEDKPGLGIEINPDVAKAHLAPGETWWASKRVVPNEHEKERGDDRDGILQPLPQPPRCDEIDRGPLRRGAARQGRSPELGAERQQALEPSTLKITDLRYTVVKKPGPSPVPVIRIDTNQGVYGPGECVTSRTMTSIVGSGVSPACVTNTSVSSWCCTRDGRRPPEVGLQEQTSNCLSAAAFKRC
ncbi:MAG: hypothetical protein WBX22_27675, partial [Silvibacterium sp.]